MKKIKNPPKISQNQPTIWTFYLCSSLFKYCDIGLKHCYKTFLMFILSMFGPFRCSVFRCSVPFEVRSFDILSFYVQSHSTFSLSMFSPIRGSVFRCSVLFNIRSFKVRFFDVQSFKVRSFEVRLFEVQSRFRYDPSLSGSFYSTLHNPALHNSACEQSGPWTIGPLNNQAPLKIQPLNSLALNNSTLVFATVWNLRDTVSHWGVMFLPWFCLTPNLYQ